MRRLALAGVVAATAVSAVAHAGGFGGFSADGTRYLTGKNQVCAPVPAKAESKAVPKCETVGAGEIAESKFRKGEPQSGATGYSARGGGRRIELFAPGETRAMMKWDAGGVVSRVTGVWLSGDKALVAVQFESRRFGRAETDVVVVRVGDAPKPAAEPDGAAANEPDDAAAEATSALRAKADAALDKRRWKKAEALYKKALAADPTDAAARYGLAVALARRRKHGEALRQLRTLARADRDKAIKYLIDARTNKAFRKLRKNKQFRRAVGLDRSVGDPVTAYERLLEGKGRWERPYRACEEAGIVLRLSRKPDTFTLTIVDECRGMTDRMNLDGKWSAAGSTTLELTFPNVDGPDEVATCKVDSCGDGSGEDCVSCKVASDLEFTLRPDRR